MISPIQVLTLWTEILLVFINLQSCSLNTSHLQEVSSYTQLPEWGSESTMSQQPVHPGDSDNFPSLSGFRWQCESFLSHQSIPLGGWWLRSHLHLVAGTASSVLTAAAAPATARASQNPCAVPRKMPSKLPRRISLSQSQENCDYMAKRLTSYLLHFSGDATP